MEFFSNAIQKAQASVDQALGIDATIANEAMGELPSPVCRAFPTQMQPCRAHAVFPRFPARLCTLAVGPTACG